MERKEEALITANKRDLSSAQLHRVKNVFHWREVSPNKFLCSRFDFESFELARWSNQPQWTFPYRLNSAGILVVLLTTPFNLVFPFLTVSLLTTCSHHQRTRVELRVLLLGREKRHLKKKKKKKSCERHPIWGDAPWIISTSAPLAVNVDNFWNKLDWMRVQHHDDDGRSQSRRPPPYLCGSIYLSIFSSRAGPVFAVVVGQLLEQAP